jgi:hypothetical protein
MKNTMFNNWLLVSYDVSSDHSLNPIINRHPMYHQLKMNNDTKGWRTPAESLIKPPQTRV